MEKGFLRDKDDTRVVTADIVESPDGHKSGGQIIGINLGWDFCSEHEHGIKEIKNAFGIPGLRSIVQYDLVGADTRTITKVPSDLRFYPDLNGYAYLLFSDSLGTTEARYLTAEYFNRILKAYDTDGEISTAWSERDFGIRIKNDALNIGATILGQIYEAFQQRDVMIFLEGRKNAFSRAGLIIAIRSRVPEDILNQMKEVDTDYLNLREAVEKTGIEEKLKAAGKHYYALNPRWAYSNKPGAQKHSTTQHPVIFWLNPRDQQDGNPGWFTVEELSDWTLDKGPVSKKAKA